MKTSQFSVLVFTTVSFAALLTSGCSAKVEGGNTPIPFNVGPQGGQVPPTQVTTLEGKWSSACIPYQNAFLTTRATFNGTLASTLTEVFQNDTCTGQALFTDKEDGTFSIGKQSPSVPGASEIDLTLKDSQGVTHVMYQIFKTDGSTLQFGTKAGDTPAARPQGLDEQVILKKIS